MKEWVGKKLYGYCNGFFGRDYSNKVIEAVGEDWVVARMESGYPQIAHFSPGWQLDGMVGLLEEWSKP